MRRITDDLWVVHDGLFAERRGTKWYASDEESTVLAGPFPDRQDVVRWVTGIEAHPGDLMTLRQAARHLPVTFQALYALRKRGSLPAPRQVADSHSAKAGKVELYSLADLAALYEGKTKAQRIGEGARNGWAKLTPQERAERMARVNASKEKNR